MVARSVCHRLVVDVFVGFFFSMLVPSVVLLALLNFGCFICKVKFEIISSISIHHSSMVSSEACYR